MEAVALALHMPVPLARYWMQRSRRWSGDWPCICYSACKRRPPLGLCPMGQSRGCCVESLFVFAGPVNRLHAPELSVAIFECGCAGHKRGLLSPAVVLGLFFSLKCLNPICERECSAGTLCGKGGAVQIFFCLREEVVPDTIGYSTAINACAAGLRARRGQRDCNT